MRGYAGCEDMRDMAEVGNGSSRPATVNRKRRAMEVCPVTAIVKAYHIIMP